jgi:hypothetical protein
MRSRRASLIGLPCLLLVGAIAAVIVAFGHRAPSPNGAPDTAISAARSVLRPAIQPLARSSPGFRGTVTTAGAPVEGARVQLFADRLSSQGGSPCPDDPPDRPLLEGSCETWRALEKTVDSGALDAGPLAETTTDAEGHFSLPGNAGARYLIRAEKGRAPAPRTNKWPSEPAGPGSSVAYSDDADHSFQWKPITHSNPCRSPSERSDAGVSVSPLSLKFSQSLWP